MELHTLYLEDQKEHVNQPNAPSPAYQAMRRRDLQRRVRVMEIVTGQETLTSEDYYQAAWIMNHGDSPGDARNAHFLALCSSELGHRAARWLAAASYDRWQMYQGKPQKYGTNYVDDGQRERMWDIDPQTTDQERAAWDVPSLEKQLRKAEEANRQREPKTEQEVRDYLEAAPQWLKDAIKRWQAEEGNTKKDLQQ